MGIILCCAPRDIENKYQTWSLPLRSLWALRKDDVFMKHILHGKIRYCSCAKVSETGNKCNREPEKMRVGWTGVVRDGFMDEVGERYQYSKPRTHP